ncbi:MAG TPA: GNAT family N-acetyltransferase [Anaerolineales bacterium]|jgi:ribosomal-protein-alanine N-acetyltransferase|nr:GNAT family N-acetyltransferase [Anaerolineales bacterium]
MEIQPAGIRDLGALRRLELACFEKDAWPLLDLIAVLTWPDVIRLKAVENGEMIGFVAGDPRSSEGVNWVATIGVDPRYQRRGIGRALLRACEEKTNLSRMKLTVRMSNEPAISLYEKEGYRSVDIWRRYYNDGEDGIVMEKRLPRK